MERETQPAGRKGKILDGRTGGSKAGRDENQDSSMGTG
jgi:hypothetical protein